MLTLCATVLAAPQGYNYQQQQQDSISADQAGISTNAPVATTQQNHGFLQEALQSGGLQQSLFGQIDTQQFSTAPKFPEYQSVKQQSFGFGGVQQPQAPFTGNFVGQQQFGGFAQQYPAPNTVTKDIYVHVAPDEREEHFQQPALPPPPPRKHYRIVFIKTPSPKVNKAAFRIQQAPTEEKTIIYVLTKKPDPLDLQTAIENVQPKQPSKPEVYFIKYKTQEEAQHAQRTIQGE